MGEGLGNKDRVARDSEVCKLSFGERPLGGAKKPETTEDRYCIYDNAHRDYTYTKEWVDFLVNEWNTNGLRPKVCPPDVSSETGATDR